MFNKNARRVLSQIDSLPTLPDLYNKIKEAIESPTGSLADVGKLVSQDIGMSANILKQVNSSFWGLPQKVSTPEMAVNLLGSDLIRSLILSAHILRALPIRTGSGSKYSVDQLMKESTLASRIGRELATLEGLSRENKDAASISGLFHDLGELILNSYFPESHDVALTVAESGSMPLFKAETDVLGVNHQELGAYLLGIWGMSMTVVEAVAKHHEPTDKSDTEESLVVLISAASAATIDLHILPPYLPESLCEIIDRSKPGRSKTWLDIITSIMKEVAHDTRK